VAVCIREIARTTRSVADREGFSVSDIGGPPKAAPRKKLTTARDYKIEKQADWQQLAEELAKLTARNQIVVELAGGVLSHAYYILRRHGARVECVDLFGADAEVREFNKLVTDKIPSSIQQRGEGVEVVELRGDAFVAALKQKIVEEAYEAFDARSGELLGELADVEEVVACPRRRTNRRMAVSRDGKRILLRKES